ncbi:Phosphoenolpyruvate synthase [hydrothermal vent metagenome]|uniref:pyruvate, water dikinase n=1 Tax=hydrothermal vent metagenome TaxID=652676 RepID=A0A3B0USI4_9ZZZZ
MAHILWMEDISMDDVSQVGGKNASLGEMISKLTPKGVNVPSGFVVTADAYYHFLKQTGLDNFIEKTLDGLDTRNLKDLSKRGKKVRSAIHRAKLPADLANEIMDAYKEMEKRYGRNADVAVRSSATAEDLPGASFAGEQETYLGIRGGKDVVKAVKWTMASLFTDRAISYRADKGFDHMKVALSAGVQKMVRSDKGASGVMFSVDTESGFKNTVVVNATWGLGEMIVQGHVIPDEYIVFKPTIDTAENAIIDKVPGAKMKKMIYAGHDISGIVRTKVIPTTSTEQRTFVLTDDEVKTLARWAIMIEKHYTDRVDKWTPMDMEWAKDGETNELFIVQARPETVQAERDFTKLKEYELKSHGKEIVHGISVGSAIATGKARVILDTKKINTFKQGEILVTGMTDPDWEPIMRMASAIITDRGGRTSHAAIVSRELGVPAIVGTGNSTKEIKTGQELTVDTIGSEGTIYDGIGEFEIHEHDITKIPQPHIKVMVNVATPDLAFEHSFLPVAGVGLAREEFIIASHIGIHPLALLNFDKLPLATRVSIGRKMIGWKDPVAFYREKLAYGIARIGAAFYPRPVIVRFSDFKTNEYSTLEGGSEYEPKEANPMIGWRGASRYYDPKFEPAFALEVEAIRMVRETMGLDNVIPMVPFCRTLEEADQVIGRIIAHGIVPTAFARPGEKATPVYMMCEIPSNVLLADDFLDRFDGMSIGSNDLTQLTLGLDRDSEILSGVGNEDNPAVKKLIEMIIAKANERGKYIGICGQGPSDLPDFADFLVERGIQSMSLNPDVVIKTMVNVARLEKEIKDRK